MSLAGTPSVGKAEGFWYYERREGVMGTTVPRSTTGLSVPETLLIPLLEGDGTGPDIRLAARRVFDEAVARAYSELASRIVENLGI